MEKKKASLVTFQRGKERRKCSWRNHPALDLQGGGCCICLTGQTPGWPRSTPSRLLRLAAAAPLFCGALCWCRDQKTAPPALHCRPAISGVLPAEGACCDGSRLWDGHCVPNPWPAPIQPQQAGIDLRSPTGDTSTAKANESVFHSHSLDQPQPWLAHRLQW